MKKNTLSFLITAFIISALATACSNSSSDKKDSTTSKDTIPNPMEGKTITVKTFQNDSVKNNLSGYGYDIYIDSSGSPTVHQPNIPAVPGNKGFATESDAKRIGELVAGKVKNNIMPPSISPAELDSLGVKY